LAARQSIENIYEAASPTGSLILKKPETDEGHLKSKEDVSTTS
jgi:hypothetical protein